MSIVGWIVLGIVAGLLASAIWKRAGRGAWRDVGLGVLGSVSAGFLYAAFGGARFGGLDGPSLVVALIGAILVLGAHHMMIRPGSGA
jgi:uncharacterized membrane protein YeaQ/YmgE (transglycosylase-associated protein family)